MTNPQSGKKSTVLREITPLGGREFLYVADRHKALFSYPLHNHEIFELNFIMHGKGLHRIVGDSQKIIGNLDLVLITGPELEHVWEQGECNAPDVREVTMQFEWHYQNPVYDRLPLDSITKMLDNARLGLEFPPEAIMQVYHNIDTLSRETDRFHAMIKFIEILHTLSLCNDARQLASTSFANLVVEDDSKRTLKVKQYIEHHYMDKITLADVADIAAMSPSSFSRFFKLHTGKSLMEYVIDIRLGYVIRRLVDTDDSVIDIALDCGFNNMSNFNNIFKREKGMTPSKFRELYKKPKTIF